MNFNSDSIVIIPNTNFSDPSWKGAASMSSGNNLPNVTVWQLNGSTAAVVYTDASGNSSFSYKNDPNNYVQLMPNGSQILPANSNPPEAGVGAASTGQAGTPWWVFMIIACVCLLFIGGGIMFAMKK
jgi:hypothetical protein